MCRIEGVSLDGPPGRERGNTGPVAAKCSRAGRGTLVLRPYGALRPGSRLKWCWVQKGGQTRGQHAPDLKEANLSACQAGHSVVCPVHWANPLQIDGRVGFPPLAQQRRQREAGLCTLALPTCAVAAAAASPVPSACASTRPCRTLLAHPATWQGCRAALKAAGLQWSTGGAALGRGSPPPATPPASANPKVRSGGSKAPARRRQPHRLGMGRTAMKASTMSSVTAARAALCRSTISTSTCRIGGGRRRACARRRGGARRPDRAPAKAWAQPRLRLPLGARIPTGRPAALRPAFPDKK